MTEEIIYATPEESARLFRQAIETERRNFSIDYLTGMALSRARTFLDDSQESDRVKELAAKVLEWVSQMQAAIERSDAGKAAVYAFKAGAAAAEMQLHHWRMSGITVTEFAARTGMKKWEVSRMIDKGELQTNRKSRKRMRITHESAMPYLSDTDSADPTPDEIRRLALAERQKRGQFADDLD